MIVALALGCGQEQGEVAPRPSPVPAEAPSPVGPPLDPAVSEVIPDQPSFEVVESTPGRARLKYAVDAAAVTAAFAARSPGGMIQQTQDRLTLAKWEAPDGRPTLGTVTVTAGSDGLVEVAVDPPLAGLQLAPTERCGPDRLDLTTAWPAGGTVQACVDPASGHLDGAFVLTEGAARITGRYADGKRTGDWALSEGGPADAAHGAFRDDHPIGAWTLPAGPATFDDDGHPVGVAATVLDGDPETLSIVGAHLGGDAGEAVLRGWVSNPDSVDCRYPGSPDPKAIARFAVIKAGSPAPIKVLEIGRPGVGGASCSSAAELAADRAAVASLLAERGVDPLAPARSVPLVAGQPRTIGAHSVSLAVEPSPRGPAAWFDDADLLAQPFAWSPRDGRSTAILTVDGQPAERVFVRSGVDPRAEILVDAGRWAVLYGGRLLGGSHPL